MSTSSGIGPGIAHLADLAGALVEQAPDALVAVEAGQVGEHRARERDRVPAPVVVAADGERRTTAALEQCRNGGGRHAGLVSEHQDQHLAARVHDAERRGDRRRATRSVAVVDDHIGAGQVHTGANLVRGAADRDHELVERARAGDSDDVAQQSAVAVRE